MASVRKRARSAKVKLKEEKEWEREGEGKPRDASTLASFTEQVTLTHREGDYSRGESWVTEVCAV